MRLELNIGLWINGQANANYGTGTAFREATDVFKGLLLPNNSFHISTQTARSGEPTVVLAFEIGQTTQANLERRVTFLSRLLSQDCIAGKLDSVGFLYGPNTEPYGGAFNADYWLSPF